MIDPLTLPDPVEDLAFLLTKLRRNDQIDRLADGLGGRIPEQALRAFVPREDDAFERLADDGIVGRRDDGRQQRTGFFFAFLVRDIEHDATAVNESAMLPQAVRVDQHLLDRAVLAAHPCRKPCERIPAEQSCERVVNHVPIDMESRNVAADVLVLCIAKQVELCLIRPEDDPVRPDPMQGDAGVFEEVRELSFASPQRLLCPLALADVAKDEDTPDNAAALVANGRGAIFDRVFGAVFRHEQVSSGRCRRIVVAKHLGGRVFDGGSGFLVDHPHDVAQELVPGILRRPADQCFSDRIHRGDAAAHVGSHDRIADAVKRGPQQFGLPLRLVPRTSRGVAEPDHDGAGHRIGEGAHER